MRRHLLGLIAAAFLGTWGFLFFYYGPAEGNISLYANVCLRAGLVLAALWLALPQLAAMKKHQVWWTLGTIGAVVLAAAMPRVIPMLLILLAALLVLQFVGWIMKPLPSNPPKNRSGESARQDKS